MRKIYLLTLACGLINSWSPAFAMYGVGAYNDNVGRYYGRLDGGYNFYTTPSATTFSGTTPTSMIYANHEQVDNNFGVNGGIGYRLNETWRTDVTLTYRPSITFQLMDNIPQTASSTLNNYTFMVNGYYDFQLELPVTLYGMLGIGASSNTTKNLFWAFNGITQYGSTTSHFAWQVGPGIAYQVSNNILADFNYQFVDLGPFSNTGTSQFQPTSWSTLYSSQLQIGIRAYI